MDKFPYILKQLRIQKDLTQNELGKLVGVSKVSISWYESGKRIPDLETFIAIADVFNIPLDALIDRKVNYIK